MRTPHPRSRRNIKRLQNLPLQLAAARFSSGIRELSSYLTQLFHFLQFPLNKTASIYVHIMCQHCFHLSESDIFILYLALFI